MVGSPHVRASTIDANAARSVRRVAGTIETYRRMPLVEWTVGKGRAHLNPPAGRTVDLLGGAALVWAVLDRPRTLDEIMRELADMDPTLEVEVVRSILDDLVVQMLAARETLEKDLAV